jgi:hypothetical protein
MIILCKMEYVNNAISNVTNVVEVPQIANRARWATISQETMEYVYLVHNFALIAQNQL